MDKLDNVKAGDEVVVWWHGDEWTKPVIGRVTRTTGSSVWATWGDNSGNFERRFNRDGNEHGAGYSAFHKEIEPATEGAKERMADRGAQIDERVRLGKLRGDIRNTTFSYLSADQLERILAIAREGKEQTEVKHGSDSENNKG